MDNFGPEPTFYWGERPRTPDASEYLSRQDYYDRLYALPYAVAALIMTITGCVVAPIMLRRFWPSRADTFASTAVVTVLLILICALVSDIGILLGYWKGPLCLLHGQYALFDLIMLSKMIMPTTFLAGLVAVGERKLVDVRTELSDTET